MAPTGPCFSKRIAPATGGILASLLLPALMLGHAAAQAPAYTYTVQAGTDYPYNDIYPSNGPTNVGVCGYPAYSENATACETRCNEAAACAGFVHYADVDCCYIKSTLANPTANARTVTHSKTGYPGYTIEYGQDYPNNDIYPGAGDPTDIGMCGNSGFVQSIEACISRCNNYGPGCVGIAHYAHNLCCYLKSTQTGKTPNAQTATYKKIICPPGAGGSTCGVCPANTFSPGGPSASTTCQPCPPGFASQPGAASCTSCAPGYAGSSCTICAPGTYSGGGSPQTSVCQACADFSVAASSGSSSCQQCPAGSGTSLDRTTCVPCLTNPVGQFPCNWDQTGSNGRAQSCPGCVNKVIGCCVPAEYCC